MGGEKIVASNYVKGILGFGKDTKLKGILKKTSRSEAKITETMLRYILYGEKNNTFEMDEVNNTTEEKNTIVKDVDEIICNFKEDKSNIVEDVDEDDDEEELRRSLEAEEFEDSYLVSNTFGQCVDASLNVVNSKKRR